MYIKGVYKIHALSTVNGSGTRKDNLVYYEELETALHQAQTYSRNGSPMVVYRATLLVINGEAQEI